MKSVILEKKTVVYSYKNGRILHPWKTVAKVLFKV